MVFIFWWEVLPWTPHHRFCPWLPGLRWGLRFYTPSSSPTNSRLGLDFYRTMTIIASLHCVRNPKCTTLDGQPALVSHNCLLCFVYLFCTLVQKVNNMAAPIEESFAEKLISFRQLLDATDIDTDTCAHFYTEYNMSIIRDLTLCVQITENRHVVWRVYWRAVNANICACPHQWRSNVVDRMRKVQGSPSAGAPELQAKV